MAGCPDKRGSRPVGSQVLDTSASCPLNFAVASGDSVPASYCNRRCECERVEAGNKVVVVGCASNHALRMGNRFLVGIGSGR